MLVWQLFSVIAVCHVNRPGAVGWRLRDHVDEKCDTLAEASLDQRTLAAGGTCWLAPGA